MNKKNIHLFLFFLIAAICLSPRFSFGALYNGRHIDIRAEDIILCLGLMAGLFYIFIHGKHKLELPPLFLPIASICSFGFFCVLINLLLGNIILGVAFFYFLKEIEFFLLYFIVFYCLSSFNFSEQIVGYCLFFGLVNIFWIVYVFFFNVKWSIFYGPNSFVEPRGPFPSGGFFLMFFIFFLNLFIFYFNNLQISRAKKMLLFATCVLPSLGVISSGSMDAVLGLFSSIPISLFLLFKNRINFAVFLKMIILFSVSVCILLSIIYVLPVSKRIVSFDKIKNEYTSNSKNYRGSIIKDHISTLLKHPEYLIIGIGVFGEAHMQYMRVALERGIMGLFLFLWLMWSILKVSYGGFNEKKNLLIKGLCAGLFASTVVMLMMGVANDVFMVVKPDEVYWFFAAMAIAAIYEKKYNLF